MNKLKKIYIKTYGCQMNSYDSDRMLDLFTTQGYQISDSYHNANLVILNTCHIREKASEKVYSELGKINLEKKKMHDNGQKMVIAVAGCVAQAEGQQIIRRANYVDIVVGPQSYHHLVGLVERINNDQKVTKVNLDFIEEKKFDYLPEERSNTQVSAFLSIQEGCDKFCTYCVVPYTRGAEFSRPVVNIIDEAKKLIASGAKEITLLGQNVNAYHGVDSKGQTSNLGKLIMLLDKLEGLERIRYTTSHPMDMHDELYEAHALSKKLMPYLHLPVQSGSNRILKLMNRKHTIEEYLEVIKKLQIARSDIIFSSDFIVGFPDETDTDFIATMDVVREVNYAGCYSFKFSSRIGTPAENMENHIAEEVKSQRLAELQGLINQKQYDFNKKFMSQEIEVLFDRVSDTQSIGRSKYLQPVCVPYKAEYLNQIHQVKITHAGPHSLNGEVIC